MKANEELSYDIINRESDILLKNYWLFIFQNLRSRTIWNESFKDHIDEHYPDPRQANSNRTNYPRDFWQRHSLTWNRYYEGLVILARNYESMRIEFKLVYGNDEKLRVYSIPVKWECMNFPKDGVDIKHRGRVNDALFVPKDLDRSVEGGLTYVLREIMIQQKLTRKQLNDLVVKFMEEPDNLSTFASKNQQSAKSSIIDTMTNWNIQWDMFVRALRVLGYTALGIKVEGFYKNIHAQAISGMNIGGN